MFLIVQYYLCYPSFHKNLVPKFPTDGATFFENSHMKLFLFGCRGRCLVWIGLEGSFGFGFFFFLFLFEFFLWIRERLNN
jgi:hypothetical protein